MTDAGGKKLRILGSVLFVLTLVAAFWYVGENIDEFRSLSLQNFSLLFVLAILGLITYLILGVTTDLIYRQMGVPLSYFESIALAIVTGFYNLITPFKGGMAVRAFYLKRKHSFAYADSLSAMTASYVIMFLVSGFLGLVATLLIYILDGFFSAPIFIVFLASVFCLAVLVTLPPRSVDPVNPLLRKIARVINGWHTVRQNRRTVVLLSILYFLQTFVGAIMLSLQFRVFGVELSYVQSIFIVAVTNLSILIAITPAGLGISEAVTVFSALTIGITPAESLSAAILGRLVSVVVLFILGPIFSYLLIRPLQR